jgi:hypothetical protein
VGSSTVFLTANLTRTVGRREEAVAGAIIHFYLCSQHGRILREIGQNVTGRDGMAFFSWSAPRDGIYCFIAGYAAKGKEK